MEPLERARPALQARMHQLGLSAEDVILDEQCAPSARAIAERVRSGGVAGIAGAQGSGKSTLASLVEVLLSEGYGLRTLTLSLDDYYLARADRVALSQRVHPLLITRGVPGTHDVDWLSSTLQRLRTSRDVTRLQLPTFDKALDDRVAEPRTVETPFDVVLFEGWCLGARPETDSELREPINRLETEADADGRWRRFVNDQLAQPYAQLWRSIDLLIYLAAPSMDTVHQFRTQQQDRLRASSGSDRAAQPGIMNAAQLRRFIEHFERISLRMLRDAPGYADIVLRLDAQRRVIDHAANP
jgi:D-glycerate 3-kinase